MFCLSETNSQFPSGWGDWEAFSKQSGVGVTVSHGDFYWNEVGLYQGLNNRLKYRIMIDGVDIRQLGLEDLVSYHYYPTGTSSVLWNSV